MDSHVKVGQSLKVGFLQVNIGWEQTEANLMRYSNIIKQSAHRFDLLVLPEMFHCGFTMQPQKVAQPMDGFVVNWMKQIAAEHQCTLMGSAVVEENSKFFNRLLSVAPSGEISFYNKRHLFRMGGEHEVYTAGESQLVVNVNNWRIMPLVCYDIRFPVWCRNRRTYDLLVYVANWPSVRQEVWDLLLRARAIENQCYVLGVNRIGVDDKLRYDGGSVLISPKGDVLVGGKSSLDELFFAEINLSELNTFREKFPAFLDADDFKLF